MLYITMYIFIDLAVVSYNSEVNVPTVLTI